MSAEVITIVVSAAGLLLGFITTLAAGFGWMIRRTDAQLGALQKNLGDEIKGVRQELGERIAGVERELVQVKVAVARLEGPGRHLVPAR